MSSMSCSSLSFSLRAYATRSGSVGSRPDRRSRFSTVLSDGGISMVFMLVSSRCRVGLLVSEAASRTLEAEGKLDELAATRRIARRGRRLRSELDDPLDLLDVDDVEGERASTRRVDTIATVLAAEAQQRLRLPELGPREVAREQALHEDADLHAAFLGLSNH